jgi:FixJ family two-component response regulator
MNWLEIFLAIGGTAGIGTILTLQIQRRKERASAGQEEAKEKQELVKSKKDLADLERDIYERIVDTMQKQFDAQNLKISEQNIIIEQLKFANQIQIGNIEALQKIVNDYKETCDNCQIRIDKNKVKTNLPKP